MSPEYCRKEISENNIYHEHQEERTEHQGGKALLKPSHPCVYSFEHF
jgi:hypothetical protein